MLTRIGLVLPRKKSIQLTSIRGTQTHARGNTHTHALRRTGACTRVVLVLSRDEDSTDLESWRAHANMRQHTHARTHAAPLAHARALCLFSRVKSILN